MVDERSKRIIIAVISAIIPDAKIILFGSRARNNFKPRSDIDIAVDTGKSVSILLIGEAKEMLNASNINVAIDLVDLNNVSNELAINIRKEGIEWKS
jgi:predicted nucleotidyltransferase